MLPVHVIEEVSLSSSQDSLFTIVLADAHIALIHGDNSVGAHTDQMVG